MAIYTAEGFFIVLGNFIIGDEREDWQNQKLKEAVLAGDYDQYQSLIRRGYNPYRKDDESKMSFEYASDLKYFNEAHAWITVLACEKMAIPDDLYLDEAISAKGSTTISVYPSGGFFSALEAYIIKDEREDIQNHKLIKAVLARDYDQYRSLIYQGYNPYRKDKAGNMCFEYASDLKYFNEAHKWISSLAHSRDIISYGEPIDSGDEFSAKEMAMEHIEGYVDRYTWEPGTTLQFEIKVQGTNGEGGKYEANGLLTFEITDPKSWEQQAREALNTNSPESNYESTCMDNQLEDNLSLFIRVTKIIKERREVLRL